MTPKAPPAARSRDVCHCTHERAWHNACSKCLCPFFVEQGAKGDALKLWKIEHKVREVREGK